LSKEIDVFDLKALRGIGDATCEKLESIGIYSLLDLAAASPRELLEAGIGEEKANNLCLQARMLVIESGFLDGEFIPATKVMEKRRNMQRISTGSKSLDALLGGGIETMAVTELVGDFGSGKTQLCHQLAVNVQLPQGEGGLEGSAIYIDTESTFRPERIAQIASSRGLDVDKILENVIFCQVYNSSHLSLVVRELGKYVEKYKPRLLVVDSLISHFRAEFIGRGTLAERQQKLNNLLHRLLRIAQVYNIAVVITNQVQANPDQLAYFESSRPAGGHVMAHATTYRMQIRKGPNNTRVAKIIDSPCHPSNEDAAFRITERGIEDVEERR